MQGYNQSRAAQFPFLFGGTFIEGQVWSPTHSGIGDFPSFSEGLSLRAARTVTPLILVTLFPFLFGGTFIEGVSPFVSP